MLNANDQATLLSIRELRRSIEQTEKPLIFWIGAGASKWLEYPLWKELARKLRREFVKFVAGFDNEKARSLLESNPFPQFFQMCKDIDQQRFYHFLSSSFLPLPDTDLYARFLEAIGNISPLHILTTNVDEALEQRLPSVAVFQRSDFSGCISLLQSKKPFIAKLHGTRSAIESVVFTSQDYESLKADTGYINNLKMIFAIGTVIFLGYSVSDQYLLDALSDNARDMSLFGSGPHFVVNSDFKEGQSLRRIGYSLSRFPDHRAALTVFEIIRQTQHQKTELRARVVEPPKVEEKVELLPAKKTAYFISDLLPAGVWTTSVTAKAINKNGREITLTVGLGFTNEEMVSHTTTAAHDLVVGLICFDHVYFSLASLGRVHALLGSAFFWRLVQNDIVRFIHLQHEPAVVRGEAELIGDIGLVSVSTATGDAPESPGALIKRQIVLAPGQEKVAEKQLTELESKVAIFDEAGKLELASLVRSSFLMPEVARLLGIGEAITPAQIPEWLKFPCLRMAHLVHTGAVCDRLGFQAARIPFGGVRLTSAAFGVQEASEHADRYASYVLTGKFNTDLGLALLEQPMILEKILIFRNTAEGEAFRDEVRELLLTNDASEFTAAINAGLAKNVPTNLLDKARETLSSLLTEKITVSPVPAVWTSPSQSDDSTRLWRARSRRQLLELTKERGIRGDDPCICGSGDKLRLCCAAALQN
jgi:SIR2-like domain/SEC-C motif